MSLQGTLKTLGITEVLEFLANRNATGQLDVNTELGDAVYLFSEGQIAQSEYSFVRETGSDAAEATYYVVSELDGTFFFDEEQEPVDTDSCEEVSSVLGRTADIAEKWLDVEAIIETPDDVLTRNDELDGSVTIQPEWWKALEVIGDGKTSLNVAAQLDMGLLDASMLLLAMTNAGLLHVQGPQSVESVEEPNGEPVAPVAEDTTTALSGPASGVAEPVSVPLVAPLEVEQPDLAPALEVVEETPIANVVPVAEPAPVIEEAPLMPLGEPSPFSEVVPVANPAATADPIAEVAPILAAQPTNEFVEAAPVAEPVLSAPAPEPVLDEDDGWASNHSPAFEAAAPAVAPVSVPPTPPAAPESHLAAVPDPTPLTHPPATEGFSSLPPALPTVPQFDPNAQSAAMAGEVLDDLATLGQLDEQPAPANWQLDGTFVAEPEPIVPQADADPFGDLGELLSDDDEDRGSVLKFLRRD